MNNEGKETIGRLIAMLYRMAAVYLGNELPRLEIGVGQYIFLAELFDNQGQSQDELTKKVCVDKANTARALSKLEELGYIRRDPDKKNHRIKRAYLEPRAMETEEEFWEILLHWSEILTLDFTPRQEERLLKDLRQMVDNAKKYLNRY